MREWLDHSNLDERLINEIRVAIVLLNETRIRHGELLSIRIKNVHLHHRTGVVEIEIAPGRKDSALKSDSARRRIYVRSEAGFALMEKWITRRLSMELALQDEYFFGDPHDKGRLYQPGKLTAAINRLVKDATGDPLASMHTFSHAWISRQVDPILMFGNAGAVNQPGKLTAAINRLVKDATGDPLASMHTFSHAWISRQVDPILMFGNAGAVNQLDRVASEAGHLSAHTSIIHYSHLFESALRHHLDQGVMHLEISSDVASVWGRIKADAIRARVARARRADPKISTLKGYWKVLLDFQNCSFSGESVESDIELAMPDMPAFLAASTSIDFSRVLHTLQDLSDGLSFESTAFRNARPQKWIEEVASSAGLILHGMGVKNIRVSFQARKAIVKPEEAARVLADMQKMGSRSGFDFLGVGQPKLQQLMKFLQSAPSSESLQRKIFAWQRCWKNGFISIDDLNFIQDLIDLLLRAEMPVASMALVVEKMNAAAEEAALAVADMFLLRCQVAPQKIYVAEKRGRPSAYLILNSTAVDASTAPPKASASVAGLNALLLAAATYLTLGASGAVE